MNSPTGKHPIRLLIACCCAYNIGMVSWWAQPEILHAVMDGLGYSESLGGAVISAEIMTIAITAFVVASQMHRIPVYKVCLASCALAIVCHGLSMAVTGIYWLIPIRVAAGVGEGCAYAIGIGLLASLPGSDRAYGILNAANIVFCSVFLVVAPYMIVLYGHVGMFGALAAAGLILVPLVFLLPRVPSTAVVTGNVI